jgi:mannosyltransferase
MNLFHIQYSQEARGYALVTLLALVSCYFFVGVLEAPTKRGRAAYIAASVLMIDAHIFGVWILLAQLLFVLMRRADRRKTVLLDVGIIGLLVLPLAVSLLFLSDRSQLSWMSPGSASSVYAVLLNFSGGDFSGNAFSGNVGLALLVVYTTLLLFSLRSRWREGRREASTQVGTAANYVFLWIWLLLPILSAGMISWYRPMLQARYLIVCLPAFLLLAADGLARIRPKLIFVAALAAISGVSLVGLNSYYGGRADQDHGDNWRDATAYCLSQARADDAILFPYSAEEIPFRDYQVRLGKSAWSAAVVVPQKSELELLSEAGTWTNPELAAEAAGRYRRVWVVTALQPSAASLQFQSVWRMQLREESRREFGFVTVQLFVPRKAEARQ